MIGIEFQYRIESSEDFVGSRLRFALGCPLIPRPQVHHRLGEQGADIWILWILFPDLAHRIGISAIKTASIFRLRISVPFCERIDQGALNR